MIGVLASGRGSNLQALIDANLNISVVIANVPGAGALQRAQDSGIDSVLVDHKMFERREDFDAALVQALRTHQVKWVALAGFMRIVGRSLLEAFPQRIVNIHPALLPSFPGLSAQKQAIEAHVTLSGCTVHLVDEGVDTGPILAQAAVPVRPADDTAALSERILRVEHALYPAVLSALAAGRLKKSESGRFYLDGRLGITGVDGLVSPT